MKNNKNDNFEHAINFINFLKTVNLPFPLIIKGSVGLRYFEMINRSTNDLDMIIYSNGTYENVINKIQRIMNNSKTNLISKEVDTHIFKSRIINFENKFFRVEWMLKQQIPLKYCKKYGKNIYFLREEWLLLTKVKQLITLVDSNDVRKIKIGQAINDIKNIIKNKTINLDKLFHELNNFLETMLIFDLFQDFFASNDYSLRAALNIRIFLNALKRYTKNTYVLNLVEKILLQINKKNINQIMFNAAIIRDNRNIFNELISFKSKKQHKISKEDNEGLLIYKLKNNKNRNKRIDYKGNIFYFENIDHVLDFTVNYFSSKRLKSGLNIKSHFVITLDYLVTNKWLENKIHTNISILNNLFFKKIKVKNDQSIIFLPIFYIKESRLYCLKLENLLLLFSILLKLESLNILGN